MGQVVYLLEVLLKKGYTDRDAKLELQRILDKVG